HRTRRADRQASLALSDDAPRFVGLRQHGGAAADDDQEGRQDDRRRRAGRQDRVPVRLRSREWSAHLADRRASGAEERYARRSELADAAVSHGAATVLETV